jgi:uncharacterized protein YkwD
MGKQCGMTRPQAVSRSTVARFIMATMLVGCAVPTVTACTAEPGPRGAVLTVASPPGPATTPTADAAGQTTGDATTTAGLAQGPTFMTPPAVTGAAGPTAPFAPATEAASTATPQPRSTAAAALGLPSSRAAAANTTSSGAGAPRTLTGTGAGSMPTLGSGKPTASETEVIRLVNVERVSAGCPALTVSSVLTQIARAHSQEMTAENGFRHNSPDGRTPFQRLTAAGYRYSIATENIAAGQTTAGAVMAAWTSTQDRLANMLDCRLTQIGVGMATKPGSQYGTYWTQDIATPM